MIVAPCMNCPERHFKCHAECEKYQAFRVEWEKQKEEERVQSEITQCHKYRKNAEKKKYNGRYSYSRARRNKK